MYNRPKFVFSWLEYERLSLLTHKSYFRFTCRIQIQHFDFLFFNAELCHESFRFFKVVHRPVHRLNTAAIKRQMTLFTCSNSLFKKLRLFKRSTHRAKPNIFQSVVMIGFMVLDLKLAHILGRNNPCGKIGGRLVSRDACYFKRATSHLF